MAGPDIRAGKAFVELYVKTSALMRGMKEAQQTLMAWGANVRGGKAENMHAKRREKVIKGRGTVGKVAVHGVLQRGDGDNPSQVSAAVIKAETQVELLKQVRCREEEYAERKQAQEANRVESARPTGSQVSQGSEGETRQGGGQTQEAEEG